MASCSVQLGQTLDRSVAATVYGLVDRGVLLRPHLAARLEGSVRLVFVENYAPVRIVFGRTSILVADDAAGFNAHEALRAATLAAARGTDPVTERTRLRRAQAPLILDEIRRRRDLLLTGPVTQSALAEGAAYLRNHWAALTRFLDDGRIPLDNNAAERQQRPIAIGRKNWLFVASEDGGAWASILLGIFQTCRLQQVDALTYLHDIMPACIAGDVDPLKLTPAAYSLMRKSSLAA